MANQREDRNVIIMVVGRTKDNCNNLENLGSLAIVDSRVPPERILKELSCPNVYTHMAKIRLKDISWNFQNYSHIAGTRLEPWDAYWDKFQVHVLFPNLQSLSLPNNNLNRYPDSFSWTDLRYQ